MKIHLLLNKYAVTIAVKLNPQLFKKRAVQTCGKLHPLISETTVTTYGYPSTAY